MFFFLIRELFNKHWIPTCILLLNRKFPCVTINQNVIPTKEYNFLYKTYNRAYPYIILIINWIILECLLCNTCRYIPKRLECPGQGGLPTGYYHQPAPEAASLPTSFVFLIIFVYYIVLKLLITVRDRVGSFQYGLYYYYYNINTQGDIMILYFAPSLNV